MSLPDLKHDSVLNALRDTTPGREEFLRRYGFRPSRNYFLTWNGTQDCPRLNKKGPPSRKQSPRGGEVDCEGLGAQVLEALYPQENT